VKDGRVRELTLTVETRILPLFYHVLQDGFLIDARVDCSIREFLVDQCGMSSETIASRISTVFLNGQPVDDLDGAIVENNSTLALSGAMPGLVGAVMRSNSPLRSFRSTITHMGKASGGGHQQGLVRLKFFNTVIGEVGPRFLRDGILVEPTVVAALLQTIVTKYLSGLGEVFLDGRSIEVGVLLDNRHLIDADLVLLSARTHE
jgi:hypothetical protein